MRPPRLATWGLAAATGLAVFTLAVSSLTEYDFWWYLKSGELILATGSVPATDPFSYTATGRPWINHMWATQVLFFWVWTHAGRVALIVFKGLVVVGTFALVAREMVRRGVPPALAAGTVLLAAWAGREFWDIRPQIFTYLSLAALLWLLRDGWETRRAIYGVVPALMVPWANLHAGFVTGLAMIALITAGTAASRLRGPGSWPAAGRTLARGAALFVLSLLASLANPFGWRAIAFPLEVVNTSSFMAGTNEWFSPNFHDPAYRGFELMVLLLVPVFAWGRARLSATDVLVILVFFHLGLRSIRHIPLFAVVAAAPLAAGLHEAALELWRRRGPAWRTLGGLETVLPTLVPWVRQAGVRLALAAVAVVLGTTLAWSLMAEPAANPLVLDLNEERYPVRTMAFIKERRLPAPLFNAYAWGGYELWRLYPDYRMFIDGRTHVYGSDVLRDFIEVMATGRRWRAVLDKWDVQTVLVQRDAVLAQALHTAGGWRPVFAEREAVVFVREGARNQAVLAGLAAVDLAPPTPEAVSAIADAMRAIQVGDQAGAIRRLEAALAADPEHPVALFSLAVIREERGEAAVARALLERVVRSERGGPLAQQAQDRLKRLEGGAGR